MGFGFFQLENWCWNQNWPMMTEATKVRRIPNVRSEWFELIINNCLAEQKKKSRHFNIKAYFKAQNVQRISLKMYSNENEGDSTFKMQGTSWKNEEEEEEIMLFRNMKAFYYVKLSERNAFTLFEHRKHHEMVVRTTHWFTLHHRHILRLFLKCPKTGFNYFPCEHSFFPYLYLSLSLFPFAFHSSLSHLPSFVCRWRVYTFSLQTAQTQNI